jgi:hypothetical protein
MDGKEQRVIRLQEVELITVGVNVERFELLPAGKVLLQVFHCNCSGHTTTLGQQRCVKGEIVQATY